MRLPDCTSNQMIPNATTSPATGSTHAAPKAAPIAAATSVTVVVVVVVVVEAHGPSARSMHGDVTTPLPLVHVYHFQFAVRGSRFAVRGSPLLP